MLSPEEAAARAAETVLYVPDEPTVSAPEGGLVRDVAETRRNKEASVKMIGICIGLLKNWGVWTAMRWLIYDTV